MSVRSLPASRSPRPASRAPHPAPRAPRPASSVPPPAPRCSPLAARRSPLALCAPPRPPPRCQPPPIPLPTPTQAPTSTAAPHACAPAPGASHPRSRPTLTRPGMSPTPAPAPSCATTATTVPTNPDRLSQPHHPHDTGHPPHDLFRPTLDPRSSPALDHLHYPSHRRGCRHDQGFVGTARDAGELDLARPKDVRCAPPTPAGRRICQTDDRKSNRIVRRASHVEGSALVG